MGKAIYVASKRGFETKLGKIVWCMLLKNHLVSTITFLILRIECVTFYGAMHHGTIHNSDRYRGIQMFKPSFPKHEKTVFSYEFWLKKHVFLPYRPFGEEIDARTCLHRSSHVISRLDTSFRKRKHSRSLSRYTWAA